MFTLDIKNRYFKFYFGLTLFTIVFAYVYELFSHDVYSNYMIYMFAIPLLLGVIPSILLAKKYGEPERIYNDGVITLTIYMCLKGILEIYGTTSFLVDIFLYTSIILLLLGLINWILIKKINA